MKKPAAQVHGWRKTPRIKEEQAALRARRAGTASEPIQPPSSLSARAKEIFVETVAALIADGIETPPAYAGLVARYSGLSEQSETLLAALSVERDEARAEETLRALLRVSRSLIQHESQLGLSPASRRRLLGIAGATQRPQADGDRLDEFIKRPRLVPTPLTQSEIDNAIAESRERRAAT